MLYDLEDELLGVLGRQLHLFQIFDVLFTHWLVVTHVKKNFRLSQSCFYAHLGNLCVIDGNNALPNKLDRRSICRYLETYRVLILLEVIE